MALRTGLSEQDLDAMSPGVFDAMVDLSDLENERLEKASKPASSSRKGAWVKR